MSISPDTGNAMTLIARSFLQSYIKEPELKTTDTIWVRGAGNNIVPAPEFVVLNLYVPGLDKDGNPAATEIRLEAHVVETMSANLCSAPT